MTTGWDGWRLVKYSDSSAIFRACRSVPRIMGFRVVFVFFFDCFLCVFFFAWKHGSIRFLGLFMCWNRIHLSLDFTVRWNGWGVAEEMCQPHPTSLAWLLQPQRARILGATCRWPARRPVAFCCFFGTHHFRNCQFVCGTRRQPSKSEKPFAGMLTRFFCQCFLTAEQRVVLLSFGLRGFLMSYEIRMYAKKLPNCLETSDFPGSWPKKSQKKDPSLKFQRVNFKGVCILTSEDLRTSSGTGVFAEKRFRLLFWGVKRIQRTHSEIQRLMGCQLSGSWWQVGESLWGWALMIDIPNNPTGWMCKSL